MPDIETAVIGAGVIGLAAARALALAGHEVLLIERNARIGEETSSRNSEVVHAGIYYPHGSLKALTCVKGRQLLYAFCAERGVAHRRLGKLIVATDDQQVPQLGSILARAKANGVADILMISRSDALSLEPELECRAALYSPSTGIIDSHAFMLSLLGEAAGAGAVLALSTPVLALRRDGPDTVLECGGAEPCTITARNVVNASGHHAPTLAAMLWPDAPKPPVRFARGNYFSLSGVPTPFRRLIYPVPEPGGLGVHLTLDLAGRARFGPDVEWTKQEGYEVNSERAAGFYGAIRRYWPTLPDGALVADYVGIRPKLAGHEDFVIAGPRTHGMAGTVHLLGMESPGLTASLAIAEIVARQFDQP